MIQLKDLRVLSEAIIEFKDVSYLPPNVISGIEKEMRDSGASEDDIQQALEQCKASTTFSIQGNNAIDSHIKSYIEDYNKEYDLYILAQEDIVGAYNAMIAADFDYKIKAFGEISDTEMQLTAADPGYKDWLKRTADPKVGAFSMMQIALKTLMQCGYSESDAKKYLTGQFYEKTEDPEKIREIIKARLKYNEQTIKLLQGMLKTNAKLLGLTETAAEMIAGRMEQDGDIGRQNIKLVKENLTKLLDDKKYKKSHYYDYRPIGAGCLIFSDVSDEALVRFFSVKQNKDMVLQRLLHYDVVVLGHGGSATKGDLSLVKIIDNYNAKLDRLEKDAAENPEFKRVYIKTISLINRVISKLQLLSNGRGNNCIGDDVYDKMVKFYIGIADKTLKCNEKFVKTENVDEYMSDYKQLVKDYTDAIKTDNAAFWTIQPTYSTQAGPFTDVTKLVDQLVKEGFKKIFLGCCNPGHHKLPKRIADSKDIQVAMGNNSVIIEVCDYAVTSTDDEILHEAATNVCEAYDTIQNVAYMNDIDLDSLDESCIAEAHQYLEDDSNFIIDEGVGNVWTKIYGAVKRVIKGVLWLFRKIIEMVSSFIRMVFSRFKKKHNKKLKKKMKAKAAFVESAKMLEYNVSSIKDIETTMINASNKMSAALKKISAEQTRNLNQYEAMCKRLTTN